MFYNVPLSILKGTGTTMNGLKLYANDNGIPFHEDDWSLVWNAYGHYCGSEMGLPNIACASMGSICSLCFTGLKTSCGTDVFIKEEIIEDKCLQEYSRLIDSDKSEAEQVYALFEFILDLYANHLSEFEYLTHRISVRLTVSDLEVFNEIDGESKTDKFRNLLNFWKLNQI